MIPPPAPLSKDEFQKRYRPGMTLLEVDPELVEWHRNLRRGTAITIALCSVVFGSVMLLAVVAVRAAS